MSSNQSKEDHDEPLIDASLLANLTESERIEALEAAAIAKRAEERAEQRALERAMERKRLEREKEKEREKQLLELNQSRASVLGNSNDNKHQNGTMTNPKIKFVSKKERNQRLQQQQQSDGNDSFTNTTNGNESLSHTVPSTNIQSNVNNSHTNNHNNSSKERGSRSQQQQNISNHQQGQEIEHHLSAKELLLIKKSYLGESASQDEATIRRQQQEKLRLARKQKKITFKFEWDASEDTSTDVVDIVPISSKVNSHMTTSKTPHNNNKHQPQSKRQRTQNDHNVEMKPLHQMTSRDWRIYRENYDITVKGGKAPPPLRNFHESKMIHPYLLQAIEMTLRYKTPSPIQKQAIPIGLQRRDLIGIAETGSGKTAAFGIPLCHLIFSLPKDVLRSVVEQGPLALVMAPTRELALQIDIELNKLLSRQTLQIRTTPIVGGQNIQHQAMALRNGVHIVVGTPGRINECLESAYLVLNQCSYIVLDEADRMIDLGFAPQIESILDAMGGLLKSENETEAYEQELEDLKMLNSQVPKYRLTAMFSATMPSEVQRLAKQYLRHPAIVSVGDQDSGKNQRIEQRVLFLANPSMKERALRDVLLNQTRLEDKVIVFVNEKKHADGVGRMIERIGRRCVVLHGGKTQEQREENLEAFKRGGYVLCATDVAGRGLDVPNVKHVINYDLPTRSIDNYCHRIGRTGRAGNQGYATSFITDEDEGIMAALKSYLESTGSVIPDRLARHPAANSGVQGSLIH